MIIRSQDKKSITTDLNIQIYDCDNGSFEIVNGTVDTLGIYSTEEKAIKVLDMIQSVYTDGNEWLNVAGKVFQMPQDSEV